MKYLGFIILCLCSTSAYCQYNISKMMEAGRNALEYKDYSSAIKYFNNIIETRPQIHDAFYYRGQAKFYLGDYVGAEMDLSEVLALNPYYYDAYDLRGLSRLYLHKYNEASSDYNNSTIYKSDDPDIWYNLIYCKLETGNFIQADSISNIFISHWPALSSGYLLKARCKYNLNRADSSEIYIDKALSIDPYNIDGLNMKSILLFQRCEWRDALEYFSRSLYITPNNSDNLVYRGICKIGCDDLSGGISDFNTAISLNPNNILGLYNHGILCFIINNKQAAINDFTKVLTINPKETTAIHYLKIIKENSIINIPPPNLTQNDIRELSDSSISNSMQYVVYDKGQYESRNLKHIVLRKDITNQTDMYALLTPHNLSEYQLDAYNHPKLFAIGYEFLLMKDYVSAIHAFSESINENPTICESYYNRAFAYCQTNNYDKAISDLNKAIELNKNYAEAYYNRGLLYMRLNKINESRMDFSKAGELGIEFAYHIINELTF